MESFYRVDFSGGMFFQNQDFGKKVLHVCTSKITLKFSGVYSNRECLIQPTNLLARDPPAVLLGI